MSQQAKEENAKLNENQDGKRAKFAIENKCRSACREFLLNIVLIVLPSSAWLCYGKPPTRLQHENGVKCKPVKYPTPTEYSRQVAAYAVVFHLVSASSSGLLPPLPLHHPDHPFIRYSVPFQETSNAMVIPLRLRVYMNDGDHLLFDGALSRLPLKGAIKKY
ncbi:hypothetical protein EVAR_72189_1 [Eumeta japonica]|uniref:Uncharacterized protein n=1 Tax=Eumeta variegata TaxID=151549 RepID=A0A4C1T5E8_EUMVA|nr:hypothetical protein EVAR_72189_1 [Eumeta japonica]